MTRSTRQPLLRLLAPIVGVATLAVAAWVPSTSAGQGAQPNPALNGTWRLAGSLQEAEATIANAVNPAVTPLAPDIQRMARARIAESTWVPQTITIAASAAEISVTLAGSENRSFVTPPGQPQNVYSRSGVRAQLIQQFRPDGGLEQSLRAMDGTQVNFYTPHNGQLYLDVMMTSRRLAGEIRFRLAYQR